MSTGGAAGAAGAGTDELQLDGAPLAGRAAVAAVRARAPRAPRPPEPLAAADPVAEVAVDVGLAHLDRPFEYAVPASMAEQARPGVRVRVRFAGQDVEGFVLARKAAAEHAGRLAPLRRVVSAEPVLDAELLGLCREVADRWAGTLSDVLRLAVPRRHAATEKAAVPAQPPGPVPHPQPGPWAAYPAGPALLERVRAGDPVRAVWTALPGEDWPAALAAAAAAAASAGRGALLVVPDHRDVERVDAALRAALGAGRHVRLTADQGESARYRAWLALRRGTVRVAVGTRAAMFAPVRDLGLLGVWDDGDDLHAEPHAPYPHVREVLALRSARSGAALLLGGTSRTVEAQLWCEQGWARAVEAPRAAVRAAAPRVLLPGSQAEEERDAAARSARLPSLAWRTARAALDSGPVLVQVPRRGYLLALSCAHCRARARCAHCAGPLQLHGAGAVPDCRWCGRSAAGWRCPACAGDRVRSVVVGQRRTAEELGRAFPGVPVRTSGAGEVLPAVPAAPALVVATPGAEPVAEGGYAAALLLDGWALLERADLRAGEEALRRWTAAASLVRPAGEGGAVVLLAPPGPAPVEALVRWDPAWHAARELAERRELGLPPAVVVARVSGPAAAVDQLLALAPLPPGAQVLGPAPAAPAGRAGAAGAAAEAEQPVSALVRVPRAERDALAAALRAGAALRSARKAPGAVRVQLDPEQVA
ncbi:primosomal protein N' [Quadrisphaera sp. DSM 44207]|uniref:primosomal protein N' n=1 Tax=Quadrisphaera sp. DSM 44207 TaxID=1881057 RepID=UPI00088A7542|nr:primosomal protein N' [Quadrisphaera sp. DSM 44207]SDQ45972.1 replication restart DNA helicase PriA [Quadrisphaera sp. DSM 44207]